MFSGMVKNKRQGWLRLIIVGLGLLTFSINCSAAEEPMIEKIRKMAETQKSSANTQSSEASERDPAFFDKKRIKKRKPQTSENEQKMKKKSFGLNHLQNDRVHERSRRRRKKIEEPSPWVVNLDGSMRAEYRYFTEPSNDPRSLSKNMSLLGEFEAGLNYKKFESKFWNAGRKDFNDPARTRILPYENWVAYKTDNMQVKVGTQIENWAMAEIFHPSDIFNSRNFDSELENSEKLGEPSASLRFNVGGGFATLYYMPMFWSPILPSNVSRFQGVPRNVNLLEPIFFDKGKFGKDRDSVNQYAFRYTKTVGSADLAFHYLNAIDRQEALFLEDIAADGARPVFMRVQQIGAAGSVLVAENILKFDYVNRTFPDTGTSDNLGEIKELDHSIAALGFERTFALKSGPESTIFMEWQKIFGVNNIQARTFSIFQNDLMFGYRLSFNDLDSKELKVFLILDMEKSSETLWAMSYSQKFSNEVKFSIGVRGISAFRGASKALNDADHAFLNLTYFF